MNVIKNLHLSLRRVRALRSLFVLVHMFALAPLLLLLLPFPQGGNAFAATRVAEVDITIPAAGLPEFKTDPHAREYQGNQISGVVRTILQDARGWIWFGTQNGVARHDGTSLVYFDLRDVHDQGVTVKSIVEDADGTVWFGTTGGVTRYDGESFMNYFQSDGLPSADVWSLCVDSKGTLWIGTIDGVCRFDGNTFTSFPLPAAKPNPHRGVSSPHVVWSITEDLAGNLWFAAEDRVFQYDGRDVHTISVLDEHSPTHVYRIVADARGSIWFATSEKGLLRLDGDIFTNVTDRAGLPGIGVGDLFEDSHGNLWFTSRGLGVGRFDGTSVNWISESDGLPARDTFEIAEDATGRMWFVGFKGAYRYDGETVVNVTRDGPW